MFSPTLPGEELATGVRPGSVCPSSPPEHCHLLQAKWGQTRITQSPHQTHSGESGVGPEQTPGGVGQAGGKGRGKAG